jgi:FKBP-type peptidyl-prolyl cis-trans isomerase
VVTTFAVGERNTIAGLAWGVEGMRVGGRPAAAGRSPFGLPGTGVPGVIPPNVKLVFEVELVAVG